MTEEADGDDHRGHADEDHPPRILQRGAEERGVQGVRRAHRPVLLLLRVRRNELGGEHRRQGQREEDRAADGEGVGRRHRREDDAGHAGHGEEREEGDADDQRGERHRPGDLASAGQDALLHRPFAVVAEVPEDVLHHDDRRVDDDAEVDGAERDEIRRGPGGDQPAEGDHQRQRDVHRGDERRPPVAEEDEEDDGDEPDADEHVLAHGAGGELHQVTAVVIGNDLHPRRQDVIALDVVEARVDALQRARRFAAIAHQDDPLHHVGVGVVPDDAETRRGSDLGVGHVLHPDRDALLLVDDHVLDVVDVLEEADAADGVGLLADVHPLPADVLVGVLDGADQLRERHVLAAQPVGVDPHVVLLRFAAEGDDVDDAGNLLELAFEDPVLRRLQVEQRVALADDVVAEQLADGVPWRQLRLHPRRQLHELDAVDHFLTRPVVGRVPGEIALHVGEAEERLRADVIERRHPGEPDLERHGHVALDLLRAPAVRLGDKLDHRRYRVGVRLDVELLVGEEPAGDQEDRARENDERHPQRECDELLDHGRWPRLLRSRVRACRRGGSTRR